MRFESKVFWVEKDAREPEQYQDAFSQDPERGVAAIADGVTEGIFSGTWARLLTAAVVENPPRLENDELSQWLSERRAAWRGSIDTSRLTWFQRPQMVGGGMSTLLWIELDADAAHDCPIVTRYRGRSIAIGDSCLFHLRDGALLSCFPMTNTADFGLNPSVLRSVDRQMDHLLEFQCQDFICEENDLLVLCTDAVALWAMTRYEAGESVDWGAYWDMNEDAWREEIFGLRETSAMRYDDSTLMLLRVAPRLAEAPVAEIPAGSEAEGAEQPEDAHAVELDSTIGLVSHAEPSPEPVVTAALAVNATFNDVRDNSRLPVGDAPPRASATVDGLGGSTVQYADSAVAAESPHGEVGGGDSKSSP